MTTRFPIIEVPDNAAQAQEAMGTKFKFWYTHPDLGDCLFKRARPNTGEDWSEKIAAELCEQLGIPHATYELATWQDQPGTITPTLLSKNTDLLHGNDILASLVSSYPRGQSYQVSQHTLSIVLRAINLPGVKLPLDWSPPPGINSAIAVFIGYLLLDAWIGNGDRHHENWGFQIQLPQGIAHLSPTYDHASCLGRELLDTTCQERLDKNTIGQYAKRSRSAFYRQEGERHPMLTFDVFNAVAQSYPQSAQIWLERLAQISAESILQLFKQIPPDRISAPALEFATEMLEINKTRLLCLREDFT
jgi:hypothetical protein